jgi:hypothetical protein
MKLNKKLFALLVVGVSLTTFQSVYADEYAEVLPPSNNSIVIGENDSEVSVSGMTEYNLDTQNEQEQLLPKISRTLYPNSEGFVPQNIPLEKEARKVIGADNRTRVTNTTCEI